MLGRKSLVVAIVYYKCVLLLSLRARSKGSTFADKSSIPSFNSAYKSADSLID